MERESVCRANANTRWSVNFTRRRCSVDVDLRLIYDVWLLKRSGCEYMLVWGRFLFCMSGGECLIEGDREPVNRDVQRYFALDVWLGGPCRLAIWYIVLFVVRQFEMWGNLNNKPLQYLLGLQDAPWIYSVLPWKHFRLCKEESSKYHVEL